jgi:hypothetical protein
VEGTAGAARAPVTVRLPYAGREVGRALAAPGEAVSIRLPAVPPGWWLGEVELEPDELRADDRRLFAWRVAPPAAVRLDGRSGPFVEAALAVLTDAGRVSRGPEVTLGDVPRPGRSIVLPPADRAQIGRTNRGLAARGVPWRFGPAGPPGVAASVQLGVVNGSVVARRHRLEPAPADAARGVVLATVQGEPWLVRAGDVVLLGSRLDTAWTALPATPAFVPFLDALVNRVARGEDPVRSVEGPVGARYERLGADTVGVTVAGPDPRESDLSPADVRVVRTVLGADEVLDEPGLDAARFAGSRRSEAAGLLLALALALALVEAGVAWRSR